MTFSVLQYNNNGVNAGGYNKERLKHFRLLVKIILSIKFPTNDNSIDSHKY